ncbi:MAG TPA: serine/threonine-protein kinase [Candidatus Limnocylindria bacterium]|nr:serine/threonine-protein kinase [Candidatus Limnocylindria bacterium]
MPAVTETSQCRRCGTAISSLAPRGLCTGCVKTISASRTAATGGPTREELAKQLAVPEPQALTSAFPDLDINEIIGFGGMSVVYQARQKNLDRIVALKLLQSGLYSDSSFAERFQREARFLALMSHPNIVTVYDFGKSGEFYYLIMEFVDGVNLRQAIEAGGFSPEEVLELMPKICSALEYAHARGILHRDIKPENILLDTRGNIKIADFGIAKLVGRRPSNFTLTQTNSRLGTPHYMAPEQIEKPAEVDHRADVYSLGVLFYELLAGELPLGRFAPPSKKSNVDRRIDAIVFRALDRDRENRYQTVAEIRLELEVLSQSGWDMTGDGAARPPVVAVPTRRRPIVTLCQWVAAGTLLATRIMESDQTMVPTLDLGRFAFSKHPYWTSSAVLVAFGSTVLVSIRAALRRRELLAPLAFVIPAKRPLDRLLEAVATLGLMLFPLGVGIMLCSYALAVLTSATPGVGSSILAGGWLAALILWFPVGRVAEKDRPKDTWASMPRWLKTAGILLLCLGIAGILPSLFPWSPTARQINTTGLALFAGIAILTRSSLWRSIAIAATGTALAIAAISNATAPLAIGAAHLSDAWSPALEDLPGGAALTIDYAAVRYLTFASILWMFTRNDVRSVFGLPLDEPRRTNILRGGAMLLLALALTSLVTVTRLNIEAFTSHPTTPTPVNTEPSAPDKIPAQVPK